MTTADDICPWPQPDPADFEEGMPWGRGFRRGERVRIRSGPFENFDGIVDAVLLREVRIIVRVFGSVTPVDLGFDEVEKL